LEGSLALLVSPSPPCVLFEDDHLLVVNKPPGLNTHSPAPYAGEGIYDWLRHREPRWASLAIIHRLDKDTSGVIVFSKTTLANRSLTDQFTRRSVTKKYVLLTDRSVPDGPFTVRSSLVRAGDHYLSRPSAVGPQAATSFRVLNREATGQTLVEAQPLTGRTHQIRVHAQDRGFPILGDALYGGTPWKRLCLHSVELSLTHPATGTDLNFTAPPEFAVDPAMELREAFFDAEVTNAYRLIHGSADGHPGLYLDRFDDFALLSSARPNVTQAEIDGLKPWFRRQGLRTIYYRRFSRQPGPSDASKPLVGETAPREFIIRENGLRYAISFAEGYSVGLFLDQRENRRRLLVNHVAADFPLFPSDLAAAEVLNTFSYTCAFSVCAAKAQAHTTSLDLSRKYLDWGRRNFTLNGLAAENHEFIYGDAFDWMKRLAKKKRLYDLVILDPPTFSRSKQHGSFQVEQNFGGLVKLALPLLGPGGVLLASTNLSTLTPESFLESIIETIQRSRRTIAQQHYAPQPPDFPITRTEPSYLKTAWFRVS
jgi:23S rRNA (cytosine1962-C5)-methyltransferase